MLVPPTIPLGTPRGYPHPSQDHIYASLQPLGEQPLLDDHQFDMNGMTGLHF